MRGRFEIRSGKVELSLNTGMQAKYMCTCQISPVKLKNKNSRQNMIRVYVPLSYLERTRFHIYINLRDISAYIFQLKVVNKYGCILQYCIHAAILQLLSKSFINNKFYTSAANVLCSSTVRYTSAAIFGSLNVWFVGETAMLQPDKGASAAAGHFIASVPAFKKQTLYTTHARGVRAPDAVASSGSGHSSRILLVKDTVMTM